VFLTFILSMGLLVLSLFGVGPYGCDAEELHAWWCVCLKQRIKRSRTKEEDKKKKTSLRILRSEG